MAEDEPKRFHCWMMNGEHYYVVETAFHDDQGAVWYTVSGPNGLQITSKASLKAQGKACILPAHRPGPI